MLCCAAAAGVRGVGCQVPGAGAAAHPRDVDMWVSFRLGGNTDHEFMYWRTGDEFGFVADAKAAAQEVYNAQYTAMAKCSGAYAQWGDTGAGGGHDWKAAMVDDCKWNALAKAKAEAATVAHEKGMVCVPPWSKNSDKLVGQGSLLLHSWPLKVATSGAGSARYAQNFMCVTGKTVPDITAWLRALNRPQLRWTSGGAANCDGLHPDMRKALGSAVVVGAPHMKLTDKLDLDEQTAAHIAGAANAAPVSVRLFSKPSVAAHWTDVPAAKVKELDVWVPVASALDSAGALDWIASTWCKTKRGKNEHALTDDSCPRAMIHFARHAATTSVLAAGIEHLHNTDHSKWMVGCSDMASDKAKQQLPKCQWYCAGGNNQDQTQTVRGGLAACVNDPVLASVVMYIAQHYRLDEVDKQFGEIANALTAYTKLATPAGKAHAIHSAAAARIVGAAADAKAAGGSAAGIVATNGGAAITAAAAPVASTAAAANAGGGTVHVASSQQEQRDVKTGAAGGGVVAGAGSVAAVYAQYAAESEAMRATRAANDAANAAADAAADKWDAVYESAKMSGAPEFDAREVASGQVPTAKQALAHAAAKAAKPAPMKFNFRAIVSAKSERVVSRVHARLMQRMTAKRRALHP